VRVDVWWARPSEAPSWRFDLLHLLDKAERDRRSALRRAADQARFTVAATVLRLAAGRLVGVPADRLVVDRTCPDCGRPHGKPRLPGHQIEVSVSHSGDRVVVAATAVAPVGVDVEQIGPVDQARLADHVLAPGEVASSVTDFFRYWTRKESVLKATGDGLRVAMTDILVSGPSQAPTLLRYADRTDITASMADLSPGEGYAAAVTVLGVGPQQVRERQAAELFPAG